MKLYFSIWGYCDPSRVGYDTVGVHVYTKEISPLGGIGESEVVVVELPDTYTEEEAKAIGEKAVKWMDRHNDYNPRWAVRAVLNGEE